MWAASIGDIFHVDSQNSSEPQTTSRKMSKKDWASDGLGYATVLDCHVRIKAVSLAVLSMSTPSSSNQDCSALTLDALLQANNAELQLDREPNPRASMAQKNGIEIDQNIILYP